MIMGLGPPHAASGQAPGVGDATGWIEAGLGYGWGQVVCDVCHSDRYAGVEARFGVGRMLTPGLGLGAEVSGWLSGDDPARQLMGSVHLVGRMRPGRGPFFVQVGLGSGHYRAFEPDSGSDVTMLAFSGRIGIGAEVPVGVRYALQPHLGATLAAFGSLHRGDALVWDRAGFNVIRAGVAVVRRGTR
jgi:hypothetical protein